MSIPRFSAITAALLLSGCIIPIPLGGATPQQVGGAFLVLPLLFAAVCLWQLLAGLAKMRRARENPQDPAAPIYAKMGKLQAILGGLFLAGNVLLNLPAFGALLRGGL